MLKKTFATASAITTIAGAGVGIFFYWKNSRTPNIEQLLRKVGNIKKLTDDMNDAEGWTLRWMKYINDNSDNDKPIEEDTWKLKDWKEARRNKWKVPDSFANKCKHQETVSVKDEEDKEYKNYIRWCTK